MPKGRKIRYEGPVVDLVLPMPLELAGVIMQGVEKACSQRGLESYFREETGMGRMYVRPKPKKEK
jgi:hypothetical protein